MFPVRPKKKHRGPLGGPKLFFVMLNLFSTDLPKQRFLFITIGLTLVFPVRTQNKAQIFLQQRGYTQYFYTLTSEIRELYLKMFFEFRRMLLIDDTGLYVISIDGENLVKRMVFANHKLNQNMTKNET